MSGRHGVAASTSSLSFFSNRITQEQKVGLAWFVGTSSDFIPPTPAERAPPVHEATGGHAIQTYLSVLEIIMNKSLSAGCGQALVFIVL